MNDPNNLRNQARDFRDEMVERNRERNWEPTKNTELKCKKCHDRGYQYDADMKMVDCECEGQ